MKYYQKIVLVLAASASIFMGSKSQAFESCSTSWEQMVEQGLDLQMRKLGLIYNEYILFPCAAYSNESINFHFSSSAEIYVEVLGNVASCRSYGDDEFPGSHGLWQIYNTLKTKEKANQTGLTCTWTKQRYEIPRGCRFELVSCN